jgi:hypothetical protein
MRLAVFALELAALLGSARAQYRGWLLSSCSPNTSPLAHGSKCPNSQHCKTSRLAVQRRSLPGGRPPHLVAVCPSIARATLALGGLLVPDLERRPTVAPERKAVQMRAGHGPQGLSRLRVTSDLLLTELPDKIHPCPSGVQGRAEIRRSGATFNFGTMLPAWLSQRAAAILFASPPTHFVSPLAHLWQSTSPAWPCKLAGQYFTHQVGQAFCWLVHR